MSARIGLNVAAITLALGLGYSATARAAGTQTASTGKGMVGGGLLGAELVMGTEAALKLNSPWAYVIGGVGGAAAGGVGGYYLEGSLSPKSNTLLLTAGLLFVIPTTVAVLANTAYTPPPNYSREHVAKVEPPKWQPPTERGVVNWDRSLSLSVPDLRVASVFTPEERFRYGLADARELSCPLVTGLF